MNYTIHEAANLFPMMSDEEFNELVNDIKENGQREPITVYKYQIIDGRNRYAACQKLDIKPIVREWDGKGSPTMYAISLNLKRRHLTSAQKAAVAVDMLPLLEAEAAERKKELGRAAALKQHHGDSRVTEKIPEPNLGESRAKAAKQVGVNERYVSDAKKIKQEAPEVFDLLKQGKANLHTGKALAAAPEEVREKALSNLPAKEEGKTSVCLYCGELLTLDKFEPQSGTSKCKSCRYKEMNTKNKIKTESAKFEGDLEGEVKHLRKRVKELEIRNKELEKELADELRQHMVDVAQLQGQIFVIKGNLMRSGIDYENLKQTIVVDSH